MASNRPYSRYRDPVSQAIEAETVDYAPPVPRSGHLRLLSEDEIPDPTPAPVKVSPIWEIGRPAWHKYGSCFETNTAAFFPQDPEEERSGFVNGAMRRRIIDICGNCPVLIQCFTSSIENRDEYGYWAGISPTVRYRILRDLKKGEVTMVELKAALAFRGPMGLSDAYKASR